MPTLDYTEVFTNIKTKFIYDIVLDEESKTFNEKNSFIGRYFMKYLYLSDARVSFMIVVYVYSMLVRRGVTCETTINRYFRFSYD